MTLLRSSKKRRLLAVDDQEPERKKQKQSNELVASGDILTSTAHGLQKPRAKLTRVRANGTPEALLIYLNEVLTIGRHPSSDYMLQSESISRFHCKIYAILAGTSDDDIILSCQVCGMNGLWWNSHPIRAGSTIILKDGDVIELKGPDMHFKFECSHLTRKAQVVSQHSARNAIVTQSAENLSSRQIFSHFVLTNHVLGDGSYATVRLAIDRRTQRQVACKTIRLLPTRHSQHRSQLVVSSVENEYIQSKRDIVLKEAHVLKNLRHPNINGILHVSGEIDRIHLFLELCMGSDLHVWLNSHTIHSEPEIRYVSYQLFQGLAYLHNKQVAHRDLKPENILLHAPGRFPRVLIADFGFSQPSSEAGSDSISDIAGTPIFLPPEAVRAIYAANSGTKLSQTESLRPRIDLLAADCWSLGAIVFEMLARQTLFRDARDAYQSPIASFHPTQRSQGSRKITCDFDDTDEFGSEPVLRLHPVLAKKIMNAEIDWNMEFWSQLPDAYRLLTRLLAPTPTQRSTIRQALGSSWIRKDIEMLEKRYDEHVLKPWNSVGDGEQGEPKKVKFATSTTMKA